MKIRTELIVDNSFVDEICAFPNPTSDIITITGLTEPVQVKIYSIQGQLVKSANQVQNTIDVSDLVEGIYILNLTSNKGRIVRKIVVEK